MDDVVLTVGVPVIGIGIVLLVILNVLMLHKLRRVYFGTYDALESARVARREAEVMFGQIQSLYAIERRLGLDRPLPPMRGWAGSPDFLLAVADFIEQRKPTTVVECSSGVSTLVAARSLQMLGAGHVYSLEHDAVYAEKTRALVRRYGLEDWATVIEAPLARNERGELWYAEARIPTELKEIDMLVVDGPPSPLGPMIRYPALSTLYARMAGQFAVFLDDADRPEEREAVRLWLQEYPELNAQDLGCEKGLVVLQRGRV